MVQRGGAYFVPCLLYLFGLIGGHIMRRIEKVGDQVEGAPGIVSLHNLQCLRILRFPAVIESEGDDRATKTFGKVVFLSRRWLPLVIFEAIGVVIIAFRGLCIGTQRIR